MKQHSFFKRAFSMLVAITMIMSLCSTAVLADTSENEAESGVEVFTEDSEQVVLEEPVEILPEDDSTDNNQEQDEDILIIGNDTEYDAYILESALSSAPRTFEAIFTLPKSYTNRAGVLVGNYDGGKQEQINIEIYNNGKPRLYYKNSKTSYTYLFTTDVRSDSKTHLAITIDGLTASLYLNGELKETVSLGGTFSNACDNFMVGADNRTGTPQYFKGTIYGVNMFSDVRTAEEVKLDSIMVLKNTDGLIFSKYFTN